MKSPDRQGPQTAIGEEAARWLCELREGDREQQAAFFAWLRRSPQHVEEFLFATAMWKKLSRFGEQSPERVERLLAEAAERTNVVGLKEKKTHLTPALSPPAGRRGGKRRGWAVGVAAAAVLVLGAAGALWLNSVRAPTFATGIGEQRIVQLEDGSQIDLNTRSRISVRYSGAAREIRLLEGEALFTVEKDPLRPFRVAVGSTVIRAIGTQFNVYKQASTTKVSVVEGVVRVAEATELSAGEEARVAIDGRVAKQTMPDVAKAVAWRERRLVFRADRLEDVAAEVNRYSRRPIRVEDDTARNLRLTAIFDADDPESLVRFLDEMESLSVEKKSDAVVVRTR